MNSLIWIVLDRDKINNRCFFLVDGFLEGGGGLIQGASEFLRRWIQSFLQNFLSTTNFEIDSYANTRKSELRLKRIFSWKILPSIDHLCRLIFEFLTNNIKSRVLPETCSLYQISSGQGGQWSFCHDLMRSFYSMNVEPGRKGQGSRCWRCWTRPLGSRCPRSCLSSSPGQDIVQKWDIEAVSRRLLARSHLNVLHLDTLHLFFSSHLDVLQAFASQLAAQSLCQLVAKVSRAPLQKEETQNC